MKKIPGFLEDRDKTVRDEGKFMVIEIYRYCLNFIYVNITYYCLMKMF